MKKSLYCIIAGLAAVSPALNGADVDRMRWFQRYGRRYFSDTRIQEIRLQEDDHLHRVQRGRILSQLPRSTSSLSLLPLSTLKLIP